MAKEFYRWIGTHRKDNVVVVDENYDAYVFNVQEQEWEKDNEFLKAKWDPGSDFEAITQKEAEEIVARLKK